MVMLKQFLREQKIMIIGFVAVLAVFVAFALLAEPGTPGNTGAQAGSGSLVAEETSFDFGTVSMAAGKVNHRFVVKNQGSKPITLTKLFTSCMCTVASLVMGGRRVGPFGMQGHGFIPTISEVLEAGQSIEVEAVFDPNAHGPAGVGRIERVVSLENDDGRAVEFNFSATVTP